MDSSINDRIKDYKDYLIHFSYATDYFGNTINDGPYPKVINFNEILNLFAHFLFIDFFFEYDITTYIVITSEIKQTKCLYFIDLEDFFSFSNNVIVHKYENTY
jgi:hypothetical protein